MNKPESPYEQLVLKEQFGQECDNYRLRTAHLGATRRGGQ